MRQQWKYRGRKTSPLGITYHVWHCSASRLKWAYEVEQYGRDTVRPA